MSRLSTKYDSVQTRFGGQVQLAKNGSIMQLKSLAVENWPDMPKTKKQPEKSRKSLASNIKAQPSPQTLFDLVQVLFQEKEKELPP